MSLERMNQVIAELKDAFLRLTIERILQALNTKPIPRKAEQQIKIEEKKDLDFN